MSKSDYLENAILSHLFKNTAIANIGDATGLPASTTAGSLYVSLHTASPTDANTTTTEVTTTAYVNYARVAVARGAGWTVTQASGTTDVKPAADVTFAEAGASSTGATITHFGIYDAATTGNLLYHGTVSPNISVAAGVIPKIKSTGSSIKED